MATSAVAICNLALARIGVSSTIASLTESSQEALACTAVYEQARDEVLRDFPWPFARRYVALGLVEEDPNDDWGYSYRYPSDCIRALRIVSGDPSGNPRIPYQIGHDDSGRLLFTDEADVQLVYIARFTDPVHFDATFASALGWRIAVDIAAPLARSDSQRERAEAGYRQALAQARVDALNEEVEAAPAEASWIRDRE